MTVALLDALEDVLERDLAAGAAGQRLGLERGRRARRPAGAARAVVLDDADELAGVGDAVEAEHLDRLAGDGLARCASPRVVVHRAHAAPVRRRRRARRRRCSVPRWMSTVTTGPRPGSSLDSMTTPEASAFGLALSSSSSATTRIVSSRSSRPSLRLGRDVDELGVAAPLGRLQAALGHLGAHAGRVRALLVDLVDRDDDRHLGRLGVVDRLVGLRLHAVVGGDDDHRDVGDLRAAGAHGGERLVARGVEEGDRLAVVVDLVGADVLGDAAGLARDDLGLADRVEQRRLAVVDVAHDRDDRRALDEVLVGVLEGRLVVDVVGGVDDLDLLVELVGEHAGSPRRTASG